MDRVAEGLTISLDDVKQVKNAMGTTINDVMMGVAQAGFSQYLNRKIALRDDDPLEYIGDAKVTNQRKKATLESWLSFSSVSLAIRQGAFQHRQHCGFPNAPGLQKEISYYDHHAAFIAPGCYGQSNGQYIIKEIYRCHVTSLPSQEKQLLVVGISKGLG
ncbi:hypothetical protein RCOM_0741520 [Ricinus communis]|uniref:Uncharacterized protein n=1 Tax=Ricinus communis TaxID=3988 RepID=B9SHN4_RICCO|nr:hypothetical protein RCOM_0741520 [Ricinus communis]